MKFLNSLGGLLATALLVAACGGGNTLSGNSTKGGGGGVASVVVNSNPATIAADGSTSATITAVARDANNAFVANAAVTFGASAGGVAVVTSTTDVNGSASATLTAQGAAVGTVITVTATIGGVSGTTMVTVVAIQEALTLSTNLPQIPSNSTKSATVQALLRDANNNVKAGIPVTFSSSSGSITPTTTAAGAAAAPPVPAGTTDANGVAAATVNAGNDYTNRTITVTATGGSAMPATIGVQVTGTTLALGGQPNLVAGAVSPYTAVLTDSAKAGIPNVTVNFASAKGNGLSAASAITDFSGQAVVNLTASVPGTDTLTATALGLSTAATVAVSSQSFAFTSPVSGVFIPLDTIPPTNTPVTVSVLWTSNGAPVVGQPVTFATTRGSILAATSPYAVLAVPTVNTDGTGHATVTVASSLAGPAIIAASATGVSANLPVTFVAQTPASVAVQATPSTVAINGTSVIEAVVRDVNNNLVEGVTVDFNLTVDPTGGQLSVPSDITTVQGHAQTTFTASSTTSAANGITVTASVAGYPVMGSTKLSVGGQTVFLSLGTGNTITPLNAAQYEQDWAVQALDSHGGAVTGQPISLQVLPLYYYKGFRIFDTTAVYCVTVNSIPNCPNGVSCIDATKYLPANYVYVPNGTQCANEDVGWTGIYVASEDLNQNGKLDPGNVASVTTPNGPNTDSTGTVLLHITWPKDHAYYVGVRLIATTTVQGTQSSTSADFLLPGLADDFKNPANQPPGPFSPYGWENSAVNDCSNKN